MQSQVRTRGEPTAVALHVPKEPLKHAQQLVDPTIDVVPTGHVVHVAAPAIALNLPVPQGLHDDAPAAEYEPAAQSAQLASPAAAEVPAAH